MWISCNNVTFKLKDRIKKTYEKLQHLQSEFKFRIANIILF